MEDKNVNKPDVDEWKQKEKEKIENLNEEQESEEVRLVEGE